MKLYKLKNSLSGQYPLGYYLQSALDFVREAHSLLIKAVELNSYDNIVVFCRGSSGAILAALLGQLVNKSNYFIVHFKKEGEHSHSSSCKENYYRTISSSNNLNIVIDDFVSSGVTIRSIQHKMEGLGIDLIDVLIVSDAADLDCFYDLPKMENIISNDAPEGSEIVTLTSLKTSHSTRPIFQSSLEPDTYVSKNPPKDTFNPYLM